jgi:hypothetical protein
MLSNPLYVRETAHGDRTWPGLHPPIVNQALFDRVQEMLSCNVAPRRVRAARPRTVLIGLTRDALGIL